MPDCPSSFYANCANATLLCRECSAFNSRNKTLQYDPIFTYPHLSIHPAKANKEKRARVVKQAKETERRIEKNIARATIRSGALLGDGDLLVLNSLRVEVKRRGERKSWNLTLQEFTKGKKQGIDLYAIEVTLPNGTNKTLYMLEEDTLGTLLSAAKANITPSETNE